MKNLLFFTLCLLMTSNCTSQNRTFKTDIIGLWQLGSPEIGSAYLDNYTFFSDGEFVFNVSEYDELKQIVGIKGKFKIYPDSINFIPTSIITNTGLDKLERSMFTSIHDSWSLNWKSYNKEIILNTPQEFSATLEFKKSKDDKLSILIDGTEYFLINKNPEK